MEEYAKPLDIDRGPVNPQTRRAIYRLRLKSRRTYLTLLELALLGGLVFAAGAVLGSGAL